MERHKPISVTLKNNIVDVVGLGLNAMDTICVVPRFPVPNTKNRLISVRIEPGGQVATALVTCTRLGLKARYIGSVGTDHWGKLQLASLAGENLELCVREVEGASSQTAVILVEEGIGERTILWHRDPRLLYPAEQLRREWITSARILHLDGCDTEAAIQAARWAREAGIPVVCVETRHAQRFLSSRPVKTDKNDARGVNQRRSATRNQRSIATRTNG